MPSLGEQLAPLLLSPAEAAELDVRGRIDAAVLVPLYIKDGALHAVFTKRREDLRRHAGEISFPGGRQDFPDEDLRVTALREAEEEIGLPRDRVELLGALPPYRTGTGFRIHPVVGWVDPPERFRLDPFEVAELFELPLAFVLDPANHKRDSYERNGQRRQFYVLPYEGRYIWGATAGILVGLSRILRG